MPYRRSVYRLDFESRVTDLKIQARKAARLPRYLGDTSFGQVRDMVFQCAIFQTSAALETYIKLIVESWAQSLRNHGLGEHIPPAVRASFARKRLTPHFKRFAYMEEEGALHLSISGETDLWSFLNGSTNLPRFFDGRAIHENCAYPSYKNIKKLFSRIGIQDVGHRLDRLMRRDVETLVGAFNDIRTALAHSAPPNITYTDVRDRLDDQLKLVSAIDRMLFTHVMSYGGPNCWDGG